MFWKLKFIKIQSIKNLFKVRKNGENVGEKLLKMVVNVEKLLKMVENGDFSKFVKNGEMLKNVGETLKNF